MMHIASLPDMYSSIQRVIDRNEFSIFVEIAIITDFQFFSDNHERHLRVQPSYRRLLDQPQRTKRPKHAVETRPVAVTEVAE